MNHGNIGCIFVVPFTKEDSGCMKIVAYDWIKIETPLQHTADYQLQHIVLTIM